MALSLPTNYPFSIDPLNIIFISSTSDVTVYSPAGGLFQHILPSPNFRLQASRVTSTLFANVNQGFLNDLLQYGEISWDPSSWPILGGSSSIQPHTSTDILITGHADGMVFFWDMSNTLFNLLYSINILTDLVVKSPEVISVDLCAESRILALSCTSGETLVYNFSSKPCRLSSKQKSLLKKEIETLEKRENYFILEHPSSASNTPTSSGDSIKTSSSPIVERPEMTKPTTDQGVKERETRTRIKQSSSSRTGSSNLSNITTEKPKFSWQKFFLNANVDAIAAKRYAEFFEGEKITEDLVKDLDQDMMEMAGITSVGDKMRVMKYVKNGYSLENCLDGAPASSSSSTRTKKSSTKKSKTTPSSNKTRRSKKTQPNENKKQEYSEPEPEPEPEPESFPTNSPSPVVRNKPKRELPRKKPAGYQLKVNCSFHNRITQIRIASSLSK